MEEELAAVYQALKTGPSKGININLLFGEPDEEAETDFRNDIAHRAVNEGFAERCSTGRGSGHFGSGNFLQLTLKGRQYPSYETYQNRHKKPEFSIHNSIVGAGNSGNNVGQDFEVSPQIQPTNNPSQNANQSKANKVEIVTGQFIFWLFSAFATGIGIGFAIANYLHK
jgi:hypothetical protein